MGGVQAQKMTATTFRIVSRGNGYPSGTAVQDYTILKAAETTRSTGATHLAIISATDASSTGHVTTPGHAQTSIVGAEPFT